MNTERAPNWAKWQLMLEVSVWEGVALSLGIDPEKVERPKHGQTVHRGRLLFDESKEFTDRIEITVRSLGENKPLKRTGGPYQPIESQMVSIAVFAAWVQSNNWDCPKELGELANKFNRAPIDAELAGQPRENKPLGKLERDSLLIIIAALCKRLKIDPSARGAAAQIADATEDLGAAVSDDAILKFLRDIPDAVESRSK